MGFVGRNADLPPAVDGLALPFVDGAEVMVRPRSLRLKRIVEALVFFPNALQLLLGQAQAFQFIEHVARKFAP